MGEVATSAAVTKLEIEGVVFPPVVTPPGSTTTLFLAGAGARGAEIGGKFVVFTAIGVYLEEGAVQLLKAKWKGKTVEELSGSVEFFRDICSGCFEKFTQVTMVVPLTGQQYSEKVTQNCVAIWKSAGVYTEAEAAAVEKFNELFKPEIFTPGSSILFTHSASGSLTIAFSKDGSIPEAGNGVIENEAMSEAVLESIIGEHGVSPAAKQCLASRIYELMNETDVAAGGPQVEQAVVA